MSAAMLGLSAGKIVGSVVLLVAVLWSVARLARRLKLAPELSRKAIHISLGLYCLAFPWLFTHTWEVALTCALAAAVFIAARGRLRSKLGEGLHSVDRVSYGEVLFAVSVALLFVLKDGHYITVVDQGAPPMGVVLYVLPLLMLTLCDAASAIVGSRYGRNTFRVERGRKSWEGVAVFVASGWLLSLIVYLLLTDIGRREVILLAFVTAAFGALLEASSWRGLDNLFIPLGLYFLLANLSYLGAWWLVLVASAFLVSVATLMELTRRRHESPHMVAMFTSLFFLIGTFSGVDSLLTPIFAVAVYAFCRRTDPAREVLHDPLNLVVVIVGVALAFFLVSHLLEVNTIFAFNVAFASLAAGIAARYGQRVAVALLATALAMAAMSVRTVVVEGASAQALSFFTVGASAIALAALLGWSQRDRELRFPWVVLGSVSATLGLLTLPFSP